MILFDVLPKDVLMLLLLECDTVTLSNIRFVSQTLDTLITTELKVKINKLLLEKYDNYGEKRYADKKCELCNLNIFKFPYINLHSGYYEYTYMIGDIEQIEQIERMKILNLLSSKTFVYKEEQRKLREQREKEREKKLKEWLKKGKDNGITMYEFGIFPEEHQPSGGRYKVYNVCYWCALHKV